MATRKAEPEKLDPELLLRAYATGVFPMAESADDPEIYWVRPDIRGVIPLDAFHVPASLAKTVRKGIFHQHGHAHSVEAWYHGELAGGLYGVSLGSAFFGESMFSRMTDASKVCLVKLVEHLREQGFTLLDTQFTTEHLKRFGAVDVPRKDYEKLLAKATAKHASF